MSAIDWKRNPPEEIYNVSSSQLSIARHYGSAYIHGHHYLYDPIRDVLVRGDVIKARVKAQIEAKKKRKEELTKKQETLF